MGPFLTSLEMGNNGIEDRGLVSAQEFGHCILVEIDLFCEIEGGPFGHFHQGSGTLPEGSDHGGKVRTACGVDSFRSQIFAQQLAKALRISAEQLYIRAGIVSPDDGVGGSVELAVLNDAGLTERQKQTLLDVYASFVTANGVPTDQSTD